MLYFFLDSDVTSDSKLMGSVSVGRLIYCTAERIMFHRGIKKKKATIPLCVHMKPLQQQWREEPKSHGPRPASPCCCLRGIACCDDH